MRKKFWIHSEWTSERGVWTLLKNFEAILRLQLGKISDWLVKKKCEDILRLQISKNSYWIVEKKYVMTFCDYIWARFLNNSQKNEEIVRLQLREASSMRSLWLVSVKHVWRHSEATSERGFDYKNLKTF